MATVTFHDTEHEVVRFTNGKKTGSLWGPGVLGDWYASRADVGGGKVLRFPSREDADNYLKAEVTG